MLTQTTPSGLPPQEPPAVMSGAQKQFDHSREYYRMAEAIRFIRENASSQPTLAEISDEFGLHPHHFQRVFKKWTGISPKRFLQHVTLEEAKGVLDGQAPARTALGSNGQPSLLNVSYELGLSSPSRLHDLFIHVEAMSPNAYRAKGRGLMIEYAVFPSPFGNCLMARTAQGLCRLEFLADLSVDQLQSTSQNHLHRLWPGAELVVAPQRLEQWHRAIFYSAGGKKIQVPLHLKGTNFQLQVWRALIALAPEALTTYGHIARQLDRPKSARAVGQAVGANPLAYLIPCHRVLASTGGLGGYAYGVDRKVAMLAWEGSREQICRTET